MSLRDILQKTAVILDETKVNYLVTGGLAVSVWGRPRHTANIDIVIEIGIKSIAPLVKKLQKKFRDAYIDLDQALKALKQKSDFNLIEPESGIKVDFWIPEKSEYNRARFKRVRRKKIGNQWVKFTSPEDLIISKLIWYKLSKSTRQLEDAQSVLEITKKLDQKYLTFWIKKLGLKKEWEKILYFLNLKQHKRGLRRDHHRKRKIS